MAAGAKQQISHKDFPRSKPTDLSTLSEEEKRQHRREADRKCREKKKVIRRMNQGAQPPASPLSASLRALGRPSTPAELQALQSEARNDYIERLTRESRDSIVSNNAAANENIAAITAVAIQSLASPTIPPILPRALDESLGIDDETISTPQKIEATLNGVRPSSGKRKSAAS